MGKITGYNIVVGSISRFLVQVTGLGRDLQGDINVKEVVSHFVVFFP